MKSVWNGTISFGLVSIPVKLYSAIKAHTLGFKMLCGKCHGPLKYERWCEKCKKEVPWENIVKGLPLSRGKYFIVTPEELKKLKPEKTDEITIVEFVDFSLIQMIYVNNHYYIVPDKKGIKSYFLFKKALEKTNKVAIGRFVMRDKEYTCAITPFDNTLLLSTLNYAYEIRDLHATTLAKVPKIAPAEVKLAEQLIKTLTKKKFDLDKFKDSFAEELKKAIKKGGRKKTVAEKAPTKRRGKKVKEDLMDKLRESLKQKPKTRRKPVARAKGRR